MRNTFVIIAFLLSGLVTRAQVQFHSSVKVEFEKTVYVKQLFKAMEPEWYEFIKDRLPETALTYFEFMGDTSKSIYKPGKEMPIDPRSAYRGFAESNVVYTDYKGGTMIAQKPVFEETFLVQDSIVNIKWKLTNDTRTIAGFECRKAIGLLDDSITLFAFYSDEILINGGPESANGLPGMILGLGMPRIHTTWFATKVEINGIDMSKVKPATKGKKVNRQNMIQSIDKVLKNWGDYGKNMVWNFVI